MENMSKEQVFNTIRQCSFAILDLGLYLDTHPDCSEALREYKKYQEKRDCALKQYIDCYGPITNRDVNAETGWTWTEGSWPWQKECD